MLRAEHIVKYYVTHGQRFAAVDHVDYAIGDGRFQAIVGESGSGKTTLAQILCGLIAPSEGRIEFDGNPITVKARRRDPHLCAGLQMVLQNSKGAVDPRFCAYDVIAEPIRRLQKLTRDEEYRQVTELAEQLELPRDLLKQRAATLSGGQLKRLNLARALAAHPKIMILDEAVSGMDMLLRKSILDLLKKLHRETGKSFLIITHDIDAALYTAEHISVMKDGKIIEQAEYSGDPSVFQTEYSHLLLRSSVPQR